MHAGSITALRVSRVYEATQMTDFITSSGAYEKNLALTIRNKLKTSLHYTLSHTRILSVH